MSDIIEELGIREGINNFLFRCWWNMQNPSSDVLEVGVGGRDYTRCLFGINNNFVATDCNDKASFVIKGVRFLDIENFRTSDVIKWKPTWDYIIANEVFEHIKHPYRAMQEVYDHLNDGGKLIMSVPFFYRIHEARLDGGQTTEIGVKDYWRFTPSGLAQLFQEVGFSEYYIEKYGKEELNPNNIMAWAKKQIGDKPKEITEWNAPIPENWKELWMKSINTMRARLS